jgi:polar amino acid transport system substrate-binding protein
LVLGLLAAGGLLSAQAQADQLADIKAAGVVKVATFDANPPFGSIDAKTRHRGLRRTSPKRWQNRSA